MVTKIIMIQLRPELIIMILDFMIEHLKLIIAN